MKRPLIIAHRGASFLALENSISAIKKAIELNSDMIEVDVRMTKDHEIIIMHDTTIDRTTKGTGYIKDITLEQIKNLRLKNNEHIPTLQEIINLVKGKCKLNIDVKEHRSINKILKILDDNDLHSEVLISSFNEKTLKYVKEKDSRVKTGYLFRRPTPFYIGVAQKLKVDYLHPIYAIITKRLVDRAHSYGFKVNTWRIRRKTSALKSKSFGVDGIIVDDPLIIQDK